MSWEYGVEESLFYHYFKVSSLEEHMAGTTSFLLISISSEPFNNAWHSVGIL